ncbi:hypothetical protein LZG04_11075 [Saccharothrix sp. S26]|uniref:hypothetical protein n=1 Tax=Saccharothrix sp. S26 TaxID=2907215 RepID=UPI001F30653E|nr:hypothetical protein [Saccharothrix sp. S26]MCE6995348.1 hypothetical protein [Saccharothrix sp. S26]
MTSPGSDRIGTLLLAERAVQHVHAFHGDLVARALLAEEESGGEVRPKGGVYRCRDGSLALVDGAVPFDVIGDQRFASAPGEHGTGQYTLDVVDDVIRAEPPVLPEPAVDQDDVDAAVGEALGDRLPAEPDLVADVIRPVVARLLRAGLGFGAEPRRLLQLTEQAGPAMDAAVCPPRTVDARALEDSLRELRELCGADLIHIAVFGTEMAVNLTTNAARRMLGNAPVTDPAALVGDVLLQDPPVRLHRLFAREPVDLAGHRVNAGTRVLVLNGEARPGQDHDRPGALAVRAHPRPARWAIAVAVAICSSLNAHASRLRPAGEPVRRLRTPVTRAIIRLGMTTADHEAGRPCAS